MPWGKSWALLVQNAVKNLLANLKTCLVFCKILDCSEKLIDKPLNLIELRNDWGRDVCMLPYMIRFPHTYLRIMEGPTNYDEIVSTVPWFHMKIKT